MTIVFLKLKDVAVQPHTLGHAVSLAARAIHAQVNHRGSFLWSQADVDLQSPFFQDALRPLNGIFIDAPLGNDAHLGSKRCRPLLHLLLMGNGVDGICIRPCICADYCKQQRQ